MSVVIIVLAVAVVIGVVYVRRTNYKLKKTEQAKKEQELKDKLWGTYADTNKVKESMETGNTANDVNASISILHDLANGGKAKN